MSKASFFVLTALVLGFAMVAMPRVQAQCDCGPAPVQVTVSTVAELTDAIAAANADEMNLHCIKVNPNPDPNHYQLEPGGGAGTAYLIQGQIRIVGCGDSPSQTVLSGPFPLAIGCEPSSQANQDAADAIVPTPNGDMFRLFRVVGSGQLQLENLTLRRGAALRTEGGVAPGGAVWVQNTASLDVQKCVFEENVALSDGGAIYAEGNASAILNVRETEFRHNVALRQGGGVFSQRELLAESCLFQCNFAGRPDNDHAQNPNESVALGGGLYCEAGAQLLGAWDSDGVITERVVFDRNRANSGGGAYFSAVGERKVYATRFEGNIARLRGGAIYAQNVDLLRIALSDFGGPGVGNSAVNAGGALYFQNFNKVGSPLVLRCTFEGNSTEGNGGAAAHDSQTSGMYDHCHFVNNQSAVSGGAVDARTGSRPSFNDCLFVANVAGPGPAGQPGGGGAVSLLDGRASLPSEADSLFYNCQFSSNRVVGPARLGSALYINNAAPWLLHCTVAYPSADGAAVHLVPPTPLPADWPRPRMDNSIVYPKEPAAATAAFSSSTGSLQYIWVRHTDVRGLAAADFGVSVNNIDCDPRFVLSAGPPNNQDDVHLQSCSPCIDRASKVITSQAFSMDFALFPNPGGGISPGDFDYDDLDSLLLGFVQLEFVNDIPDLLDGYTDSLSNPAPFDAPRVTTPRPLACESDMGADEFVREITDTLALYCDPGADDLNEVQVDMASSCDPPPALGADLCGPFCAGEDVCLTGVFDGLCADGVNYQWYFQPAYDPMEPPPPFMEITGATDPELCLLDIAVDQAGCYRLVAVRDDCLGPNRFYCYIAPVVGGPTPICVDELVVDVCIDVFAGPVVNVQPQPAQVCVGGQQQICATFDIPEDCDEPNISWYYVPATSCTGDVCPPTPPTGGMLISPTNPNDGIEISFGEVPGLPNKYISCLTFTSATLAQAGRYYVTIDCGSKTCGDVSDCGLLTVYEQPEIIVQPQARTVCVDGTQSLCLTAELTERTLKCPQNGNPVPPIQLEVLWYRVSSCTAPVPDPNYPTPVATTPCTNVDGNGRVQSCATITADPNAGNQFYRATVRVCVPGVSQPDSLSKCPVVYSDCVTLTVVDPMPCVESRLVCVGGTQCLSVNPASLPGLPAGYTYTFRWFHLGAADCTFPTCLTCSESPSAHGAACTGGDIVNNGGAYSGATTSTLRITNAQLANRGRYYVQIGLDANNDGIPESDKCMVNSNCACLIVVNPQPVVNAATVCEGGTQYLELASPLPTLPCDYAYVYQWFFRGTSECTVAAGCPTGPCTDGNPLVNNARYDGVTTDRLCIMGATPVEQGCYYVRVTISGPNTCNPAGTTCQINSNCACLDVIPQPTIAVQPEDVYVCEGNEQCFSVTVGYTGTATLCWEWHRKTTCAATTSTVVQSGTWTVGQPLTFEYCVTPTPPDAADRCYFFRVRVCNPDDLDKCPAVDSDCACLDVLPPLDPCELECASNMTDAQGNCLFCDRAQIALCCNVPGTTQPLCYQWYYSPTPCDPNVNPGCVTPIPGANSQCFEFEFNADGTNMPCGPGCYYVKINYAALSDADCDGLEGKCDAVYSAPLCIAETTECCPRECECKDNADPNQEFYALWRTGTWDGSNAEWSYDRSTTDGEIIKAADDIYLCPSSMHNIRQFLAEMLVRRENLNIEPMARLRFYEDCNGTPGELIAEFDSEECPAFLGSTPEDFHRFQFYFDLSDDCFWLRGGIYWVSVVGIAPSQDTTYQAAWVTAGLPSGGGVRPECGMPPIGACCIGGVCSVQTQNDCVAMSGQWYRGAPCTDSTCGTSGGTILGKRPQTMVGADPWMEYDPCCHPCDDFVFCVSGVSCPIMWDNGKPYLGGADGPNPPAPPIDVFGTRSEKSVLIPRDSRAADQFVIKTCDGPEEVCYLEGYIFTNCPSFEVHLEIYYNNCDQPDFVLPGGVPFYHTINVEKEDLGIDGLRVGTTNVRAYRVYVCDFGDNPLIFQPGQNYWISFSVRDSFSVNERAFFAHVRQPCEPCTDPSVWKINPGMELAPGRQIPDWRSVNADFAFLIATKKRTDDTLAAGTDPEVCIADANSDGAVAVDDIFYFLASYFAGCP